MRYKESTGTKNKNVIGPQPNAPANPYSPVIGSGMEKTRKRQKAQSTINMNRNP
jgi:hypothetical protein